MRPNLQFWKKITPAQIKYWRRVFYILGMLLGGAFFVYQIFSGIRSLIKHPQVFGQPQWLLIAIFLAIVITWMQMMGWRWLMVGLNTRLSWNDVLQGYVLSFIPRYIPGSVWGYITRAEWLNKTFGVSYGLTNLGSVLEMVFILLANVAWIITGWISTLWGRILFIILPLLAAWICGVGIRWPGVKKILARIFGAEAAGAVEGISLRRWVFITAWMILFWGLQGLSFQMVIWSVSDPVQALRWSLDEFWVAASSYNLAWFVGFIILFVPAGLGLRETVLTELIETRLKHASGMASVVSILFRVVLALGEAFWAVVALWDKQRILLRKDMPPENSKNAGASKE